MVAKQKRREVRGPSSILDENGQLLYSETSILHEEVHQRPCGGFPFLYYFGDCYQPPAVLQKPMYDKSAGKVHTADAMGRIVVRDFILPTKEEEVKSSIVIMNKVH